MFRCGLCNRMSKPGEKMLKVPHRVTPATFAQGPQIKSELTLAPDCAEVYLAELAKLAPGVNPQSVYAAMVD